MERIWKDTERILAEHAFVHDHKFPSLQAIADYRKSLSQQVESLTAQRAEVVKQMRRKDAPPELVDQRMALTCEIAKLRKEDKIAEGAIKRIQRTRESNRMESEGYIRLKADASISSKDFYEIYRMWCEENSLAPLKARSFSDAMIANAGRFNLEHCNNITNSAGRRVWGFMGVEAVARPHINGFYDVSPCTYVPEDWRD